MNYIIYKIASLLKKILQNKYSFFGSLSVVNKYIVYMSDTFLFRGAERERERERVIKKEKEREIVIERETRRDIIV